MATLVLNGKKMGMNHPSNKMKMSLEGLCHAKPQRYKMYLEHTWNQCGMNEGGTLVRQIMLFLWAMVMSIVDIPHMNRKMSANFIPGNNII